MHTIANTYNDWIRYHTDNIPHLIKCFKQIGILYITRRENTSLGDLLVESDYNLFIDTNNDHYDPFIQMESNMIFASVFDQKEYPNIYPLFPQKDNFNLTYQENTTYPPFTLNNNLGTYTETVELNFVDPAPHSFHATTFENSMDYQTDKVKSFKRYEIQDITIYYSAKYIYPLGDFLIPTINLNVFNKNISSNTQIYYSLYNYLLAFFLSHYAKQYVSDVEIQI